MKKIVLITTILLSTSAYAGDVNSNYTNGGAYTAEMQAAEAALSQKTYDLKGWNVTLYGALNDDSAQAKKIFDSIENQTKIIKRRFPDRILPNLQRIPIRVFDRKMNAPTDNFVYYSPEEKAIIMQRPSYLENLSDADNNTFVHELAHAYHHLFLTFERPEVAEAYADALKDGLYQNVKTRSGAVAPRALALKDHVEYFAELTEAYFSGSGGEFGNDYYPFDKSELRSYDRKGAKMIKDMWQD